MNNGMKRTIDVVKERNVFLDILRIIAVCLVIFTHTGNFGSKLYEFYECTELQRNIYIAADVLRTINVPLFWMISGTLLLGRKFSIKDVYKNRVIPYLITTILISYIYYVWFSGNAWFELNGFVKQVWSGEVIGLLWFMYAYIGFLMILPILQTVCRVLTKNDFRYILVLGLVMKCIMSILGGFLGYNEFAIKIDILSDPIFYSLMGYYISHEISLINKKGKRLILYGTIVAILVCCVAVFMINMDFKICGQYSEKYLKVGTPILTLYFYVLIKYIFERIKVPKVIRIMLYYCAEATFGVYLISILVQTNVYGIFWRVYNVTGAPLLSSIVYVGGAWFICTVIIVALRMVPGIKRLL